MYIVATKYGRVNKDEQEKKKKNATGQYINILAGYNIYFLRAVSFHEKKNKQCHGNNWKWHSNTVNRHILNCAHAFIVCERTEEKKNCIDYLSIVQ